MKRTYALRRLGIVLTVLMLSGGCFDSLTGVAQTRELQKTGLAAKAVILKLSDTGITVNDDPVVQLELEVQPETGPSFRASTKCMIGRLDIPQFQPGLTIPVRYDPADHTRVGVDVYKY